MKAGGKKTGKKPGKKKSNFEEWFINILAIVLLGGTIVVIVFMTTQSAINDDKAKEAYLASLPPQQDTIAHSKICMVDDFYQGNYPTLPLKLSTKTYYGCDPKAIRELTAKNEVRSATDPVTGRKVDKAAAVIALHPKRDGKVLYFESHDTFAQYLQKLN